MAVLPEIIVVIIYIGIGITLPRKKKEPQVQKESRWSRGRTRMAGGTQRFKVFLERPKAFAQRVRGNKAVVSKEPIVLEDFRDGKSTKKEYV